MSITVKFLILYLIPFLSFLSAIGVYAHAYGKPPEDTFINPAFMLVIFGFIASCVLTLSLVSHFTTDANNLLGITFSVLAWLIEWVVIGLYLVVFYGVFNP